MKNIKIFGSGIYLPKNEVDNKVLADKFGVDEEFIYKRTGISKRYYIENETIQKLAINATKNLFSKLNFNKDDVGMIVVATTSSDRLMPGISYLVQKELDIDNCMCFDILAGCSGYINAFDIARTYISIGKVKYALVIGAEILSRYTNKDDLGTAIILSDGAGATLIGEDEKEKIYLSNIECKGQDGEILTCNANEKIYMDGKNIYKYAVTDTVKSVYTLLENANEKLENIKYIIPHQSNIKIMKAIASRLKIDMDKMYTNIENVGNTFCASIPIALNEMFEKGLLKERDKVILLGYGGGLNTGSILLEV